MKEKEEVTLFFTSSQPLRFYQGEEEKEQEQLEIRYKRKPWDCVLLEMTVEISLSYRPPPPPPPIICCLKLLSKSRFHIEPPPHLFPQPPPPPPPPPTPPTPNHPPRPCAMSCLCSEKAGSTHEPARNRERSSYFSETSNKN